MTSDKKKILYFITKSNWGGAQKYVYDLATALTDTHDILVATGGSGRMVTELQRAGIRTHVIGALVRDVNVLKEFSVAKELFTLLRAERPDVVHVNSSKAGGLGAFIVRVHNIFSKQHARIIFTAHGWAFKEDRSFLVKLAIGFFSYLTVVFAHTTITVSEDDYQRALWMPFVRRKLHTIHIGISTALYKDKNDAQRELFAEIPKPKHSILVGTIAELHRNKGLIYALGAFETLKKNGVSAALAVIGDGEERKHLENLIRAKDLEDTVLLLGAVPDAAQFLPAFDIFLLPSVKEGLPYTILEAGAATLPVVATAVGGIPEVIEDMRSGILVRPKNAAEIAGALELLAEDPEKRALFGDALHERVLQSFSFERMLQATRGLYSDTKHQRPVRQA